jgi:uncharacterized protein (DUF58 family)
MKSAVAPEPARVHAALADLVRLRGRATGFSFLPRQPVHSILTGRHASRLRGRGLNFEELRHYVQGDDTRTIDWVATARLHSPHVRVFTEERDRPVLLVIDQRLSMFFGSHRAMKSVAAAEAAALAAWRTVSVGDRVGAIVFSDTAMTEFRPQARSPAVMRILGEVVRQNSALGIADDRLGDPAIFNAALLRAARLITHDWLVCIISDMDGADPESVRLVTQMTAHNDVLAVFIYDPLEAALPNIGAAVIGQAGMQLEVDTSVRRLRHGYARDFAERRARLEQLSRERAIAVLPIATDRPVEDQLRAALGERLAANAASAALAR